MVGESWLEIPAQDHCCGDIRKDKQDRGQRHFHWSREANFRIEDSTVMALISSCQVSSFLTSISKGNPCVCLHLSVSFPRPPPILQC